MYVTVVVSGLNLEKLLRLAVQEGITLHSVLRQETCSLCVSLPFWQEARFAALCSRFGWEVSKRRGGFLVRVGEFVGRRKLLLAGIAAGLLMVWISAQMIFHVEIRQAMENSAQVRRVLQAQGVRPGRFKAAYSTDDLRDKLALALPGLSFAGVRYLGSTMVIDCQRASEGEQMEITGTGMDIVASRPGIITRIAVTSGTPQVEVGQAVRQGQVLISGYERTEKGGLRTLQAQGQVHARVWAEGSARVSLREMQTTETGQRRTRATLCSPWHRRVVRDAEPFKTQDVSREIQPVIGLYLPLWREIEHLAQTRITSVSRSKSDAAAMAQGAAEKIAKKQCPRGTLILDKNVDYSMIDNEFVYAVVVLEYEDAITARLAHEAVADGLE